MISMIAVFFTFTAVGFASDIENHWAKEDILELNKRGIIAGVGNDNYAPDVPVTRGQFVAFLNRSLELSDVEEVPPFSDVPPEHLFFEDVQKAVAANLISGYEDGTFKPERKITREEMAILLDRALNSKGIVTEGEPLPFSDKDQINSTYIEPLERIYSLNLIQGYNNKFDPKGNATRADAAAVILGMLKVIETPASADYKVASINSDGSLKELKSYETYADAAANAGSDQVVVYGNKIVWMKSGIVTTNGYTVLYTSPSVSSSPKTYVATGTELNYLDTGEEFVKVEIANAQGYVQKEKITLVPTKMIKERSYYYVSNNALYHKIYSPITASYVGTYLYGKAPMFMKEGERYYSWNGSTFTNSVGSQVGEAYQYFNMMPLYTKTSYTAEQLNSFVKSQNPNSPLAEMGHAFKKAESDYGINALYFLVHAIHESSWGTSKIAVDKNNLFGLGAVDSNPYENAYTFESLEEGIYEAAKTYIVAQYFNTGNWRYNGALLGNKGIGMNVRYASDPYWGQKIAGIMYRADQYLKGGEVNRYSLAVSLVPDLNVRTEPNVSSTTKAFALPYPGVSVLVLNEVSQKDGVWYEVAAMNINGYNFEKNYVYSNGSYGTLVKAVPVVK
ncbi:S-layer protein [Bacillus taeanensis]|uniref:S-layer protein n=2 Tax=Bacillus taeanensis TaxID=273032 RepID=A0A366XS60_9BACI|nr:S-layer protein [Bacillus taeanensis]